MAALSAYAPAALPVVEPGAFTDDREPARILATRLAACSNAQTSKRRIYDLSILDLPEELLLVIAEQLSAEDLSWLELVCSSFRTLLQEKLDTRWKQLFEAAFNSGIQDSSATVLQTRAAQLAANANGTCGWKRLFVSKTLKEREAKKEAAPDELPWEQPCRYELQVALNGIVAGAAPSCQGLGMHVLFLLDGSGSVTEDDFNTMKTFVGTAITSIATTHPRAEVGIIQFSNDVQVEANLQAIGSEELEKKRQEMARMNGGTNIALAIHKAGQILKDADTVSAEKQPAAEALEESPAESVVHKSRVLVLLTDGRIDHHQGQEALSITQRLADEQENVSLHAFGVGRGVDKGELLRIIAACESGEESAEERYLGLRVLDEPPW